MGLFVLIAVGVLCNPARAGNAVISFEQEKGFPAAGGNFVGRSLPSGLVENWTNDSAAPNIWFTEEPGGLLYPDAPA